MARSPILAGLGIVLLTVLLAAGCTSGGTRRDQDSFADLVWPPPPDEPRIQLEEVIFGRADVEAKSNFRKRLAESGPQTPYDRLVKPFAVAFDSRGRILVTDSGSSALLRFDRAGRRMDVLGVRGSVRLQLPLGLSVGPDEEIYVADAGLGAIVVFDPEGTVRGVYGQRGELTNPTDVAVSPDGSQIFVTDSRQHQITVMDLESGELVRSFGSQGGEPGDFNFPTSLAFDPGGDLFVVDQLNARVQIVAPDGEPLDEFGGRGVGYSNFVRPKGIAIDELGMVYVVDNAFNNLQLFDTDLTLLTFVGQAGDEPGQFLGASGVAVRGQELAVVDQLGRRVQLFRFLGPKGDAFVAERARPRPVAQHRSTLAMDEDAESRSSPVAVEVDQRLIQREVGLLVQAWFDTWRRRRVDEHLSLYAASFRPPGGSSRAEWEQARRGDIRDSRELDFGIEYKLEEFDAWAGTVHLIPALQPGSSETRRVRTIVLMRENGDWKIHAESVETSDP